MNPARREWLLHLVFVWGLVLKGVFAAAEIVTGIGAFVVSEAFLIRIARAITSGELVEDPKDLVANYLVRSAEHFSGSTAHFIGAYLMSHGVIKLALIAALLMRKAWAYPVAIAVFGAFIAYQAYRYTLTGSVSLVLLTLVDLVVIALTWHEYRFVRAGPKGSVRGCPADRIGA